MQLGLSWAEKALFSGGGLKSFSRCHQKALKTTFSLSSLHKVVELSSWGSEKCIMKRTTTVTCHFLWQNNVPHSTTIVQEY